MENNLELVHFQICRNCNLRCYFCGQWGKKGFFSDAAGTEVTLEEWKKLAKDIKKEFSPLPDLILWGGEPLICTYFEELVYYLKELGFRLGMVTNGVFLDKYKEVCGRCFDVIYLSLDGPEDIHDSIRGKGVFNKVVKNLKDMPKNLITIMTVLTPELKVKEFADSFSDYQIFLQEIIPFEGQTVRKYDEILPDNVRLLKHGEEAKQEICLAPWRHMHIHWNGNVNFCTDYYDYTIGNIRNEIISKIWYGEQANTMREKIKIGRYPNCHHCSWRNNEGFNL